MAGYADVNTPIPASSGGFPSNFAGVRDRLYLNEGVDGNGRSRFREVGRQAGIEAARVEHGLGAVFTDVDDDGRLDLYVANDLDPNRLYLNVARPDGLGFRFVERARRERVDDPNAGMGIAAADYSHDGREDLFVTNSRKQLHAVYRTTPRAFVDARPDFVEALGNDYTGWGVSWVDLDLDGNLDLVLANGAIPLLHPKKDAQRLQVLENLTGEGRRGEFADAGAAVGLPAGLRLNGRGLAAADYDNDGDVDVAVNSIGGPLLLLRNSGARGPLARGEAEAASPPGRRSPPCCPAVAGSCASSTPGAATSPPRIRAPTSASAPPRSVAELIVRSPDGGERRLTDVAADQVLALTP